MTGLAAAVRATRGEFTVDVELAAAADELVVLLGPNGAGKSTLLHALAGLLPAAEGRIELAGEVLLDTGTGVDLPPERRPVGVVFQDGLLFPHLTLAANVAFGLRARGTGRRAAQQRALGWLDRIGLADRAGDRPSTLSGGQAQLVALARALATEPALLLLDEPLSALDAQARPAVRTALRRHLDEFSGVRVVVTHDPIEALVLADRLVVLEHGRVTQVGPPSEVSRRPRSPYAASVVGLNLWRGTWRDGELEVESGVRLVAAVPDVDDGPAIAVVPPAAVALHRAHPEGTPRNVVEGVVAGIETADGRSRVQVEGALPLVAEVTPAAVADLDLAAGDTVFASVKASEVTVYAA
jgi:molybdate transport system ATP-binding protein